MVDPAETITDAKAIDESVGNANVQRVRDRPSKLQKQADVFQAQPPRFQRFGGFATGLSNRTPLAGMGLQSFDSFRGSILSGAGVFWFPEQIREHQGA